MTLSASILASLSVYNWSNIHTLAFLYTDPGSGALLWQLLLASFFGGLFYARSFIRRMAALISNRGSNKQSEQQAPANQAASTTSNQDRLP
jgi:hypothetical protein